MCYKRLGLCILVLFAVVFLSGCEKQRNKTLVINTGSLPGHRFQEAVIDKLPDSRFEVFKNGAILYKDKTGSSGGSIILAPEVREVSFGPRNIKFEPKDR